jgi:hypothetical protein
MSSGKWSSGNVQGVLTNGIVKAWLASLDQQSSSVSAK